MSTTSKLNLYFYLTPQTYRFITWLESMKCSWELEHQAAAVSSSLCGRGTNMAANTLVSGRQTSRLSYTGIELDGANTNTVTIIRHRLAETFTIIA